MIARGSRGTGWLLDPFDSRDRPAEGNLFGAGVSAPREVNIYARLAQLTNENPLFEKVHDQGGSSSCVGWGFADDYCLGLGLQTRTYFFPSPYVIYTNARRAPYRDEGCYPRLAAKGLREWGAPSNELQGAEFVESKINRAIPVHVLQAGTRAKIKNFYKVPGTGPALVEALRRALAAGHPFTFGQEVDQAFNDYAGGVLGKFRGASQGAHMTLAYGYDVAGNFLCKNQWGTTFGEPGGALKLERGYYRMSAERMMERHVSDHYAFSPLPVAA